MSLINIVKQHILQYAFLYMYQQGAIFRHTDQINCVSADGTLIAYIFQVSILNKHCRYIADILEIHRRYNISVTLYA